MSGIGGRIAVAALAVALVAVAIIGVGVLRLGAAAFESLMAEHGETVAIAQDMFERSVSLSFALATLAATIASVALAVALGRILSVPLERLGAAARRIADGDFAARVRRVGPEEIVSLADSFNQMAERLAEGERMRREFIANAAHELRTPLTNLVGYLEALRDEVVPADRATFESLREEADRLVRLARSLDLLAEGDDPGVAPAPLVELQLSAAIATALDLAQPGFDRERILVERRVPEELRARANPDHLAQVLANLLQNAVRYAPQGGTVVVAAEARPGDVLVSVSNTGDIPPQDLPHIFERFYRVEKSRDRAHGGAGIGLAIVKRLVEIGGGRVGIDSAGGRTRVWFSLPA